MSTHPYIPLYVDDYDAHTGHLTPEEDGVYSRLLRLAWRTPGCSLPDDHGWIARKIRLGAEDYERVGRPVLIEFFKLVRGRFVQKRLKLEYDLISRKKSARKDAGKKGGDAKARNAKENQSSKAIILPEDTCAFPEPYPYPEDRPPTPPEGEAEFQLALKAYPSPGLENVGEATLRKAWRLALASVTSLALLAAVRAYAASEYVARGGRPKRFDRWLSAGAYAQHLPPPATVTPWAGPADVRAALVVARSDDWTKSWLDRCAWRDIPRSIVTTSPTTAKRLTDEVGEILTALGVAIVLEAAA